MISRWLYEAYTDGLDTQYAEASALLSDYINSLDWEVGYEGLKANRNLVIEYISSLVDVYGVNAAFLAAEFYKQQAEADGAAVGEPALATPADLDKITRSVRYYASPLWGDVVDVDGFRQNCLAVLKRYVKETASNTIAQAAIRDGRKGLTVRWARVPRGEETCAWCIMLASRGFVYVSKASGKLFGHSHEHCDCDVIPSFSDDEGLEGYNPDEYLDFYNAHVQKSTDIVNRGAVDTKATLNAMRRALYPEQKDHINEVRRARYARQHPKK